MHFKNTFLLLVFILFSTVLFAQKINKNSNYLQKQLLEKGVDNTYTVWIFFNDKGTNVKSKLQKSKVALSDASIKRRIKLFKNNDYVTFHDIPVEETYVNQVTPYLVKLRHKSKWLNAISAKVNGKQLDKIAKLSFVKSIDIVRKRTYNKTAPNKTNEIGDNREIMYDLNYGSSLTQVEQINVPLVHDMGYTGNGVIICVLDAGFNNLEHQSFDAMNILDAYDFVNDDANVDDEGDMGTGDHGTMTLSTIGGFYEGQLIGPAYGASYLLAKTENTDSETQVEEDNWVAGAQWAEALGAEITSTSLGYIDFDDGTGYDASELDGNTATITIAADIMSSLGVLVVNSAGNSGPGPTTIGAPADGDEVLAVGAVTSSGTITSFSSMGPTGDGRTKPEVMAMGSGVVVAETSGNSYTTASGTSFSCPLTAGAAALLWEMVPAASNMEIFEALKMTANNANSPNNQYGWGIIDVYAAYEYLALPKIETLPLSDTENESGPYEVTAEVTTNYDFVADTPKLYYRVDSGSWNNIVMTSTGGDTFVADIPGIGGIASIDYYITAENINALVSSPEDAPTSYYSFNVVVDTESPQIIHNSIAEYYHVLWSEAAVIATLTDNIGIDLPNSYVEWKVNGTVQTNLNFTSITGDDYKALFPFISLSLGDVISYRILVTDSSSGHNTATYPASGYQEFTITNSISFEQNQFSHNWLFSGDQDWYVTSSQAQEGTYSAQSGNIDDLQHTTIALDFTTDVAGTISFYKKVSSESSYDYLYFYINDIEKDRWAGEEPWSLESYNITAGSYNLKWKYKKDVSISNGSDAAWIDRLILPFDSSAGVDIINEKIIKLYPNPAKKMISIEFNEQQGENIDIFIYSSTGKLVKSFIDSSEKQLDISSLSDGMYMVKISVHDKTVNTKLIILN